MEESEAADEQQACPRCHQTDFNYEDLDEGTKLVCRDCGYVREDVVLVHQRTFDEDTALQSGVRVAEADDGRLAGAALVPGGSARQLTRPGRSRHLVLSHNKERLDGALSYLELPQHIANAARRLLDQVVKAFGQAEQLMQVSPATVAAVIYTIARQEGRALSLGVVASTLDVTGPEVFREFRRVVQVCDLHVPPPSLEATVIHAAAQLLPIYAPSHTGPLRSNSFVRKALQLTQLLLDVGGVEGRSPWVGAGAVWSIVLAEHFRDAAPKAYAKQVAGHLQQYCTTQSVQQHIITYEKDLASLLKLLPFVTGQNTDVAVQVTRHAGTLLKLQGLSRTSSSRQQIL